MYIREQFIDLTYKALYESYQNLAGNRLHQIIELNKKRIAKAGNDAGLLIDILEGNLMPIEQDSVYEKYALPLAKRIQMIQSADAFIKTLAVDDEFRILKKLKRNSEAMKGLELYHAKNPNEPLILSEMARMKILAKDPRAGLAYLQKAKLNLNSTFTKQNYLEQLKDPDYDSVRNTPEFKKLLE
jgi:hypothetical protein